MALLKCTKELPVSSVGELPHQPFNLLLVLFNSLLAIVAVSYINCMHKYMYSYWKATDNLDEVTSPPLRYILRL